MFGSRIVHVPPALEAGLGNVAPQQMHCLLVTFLRKRGLEKFSLYILQLQWVTALYRCNFGSRATSSFWLCQWNSVHSGAAVVWNERPHHGPSHLHGSVGHPSCCFWRWGKRLPMGIHRLWGAISHMLAAVLSHLAGYEPALAEKPSISKTW